jgi:CDP-3, 6-dideoxy-D-glycero-L-glycero-4-hexulose-4-reductase
VKEVRTIVVTGATGFLGRHVLAELSGTSLRIFAVTRDKSKTQFVAQSAEVAQVDSHSSTEQLCEFFEAIQGPVVLVHLATHYSSAHSATDVEKLVDSNISFPLRLVDALSRTKPGSAVLNISTLFQHFESKTYSPVSLYAATKEAFLKLLDFYAEMKVLRVADLTVGDIYGSDDTRGKLMNLLISNVGSEKTLNLGSGSQNMSLIHVSDAARAIVKVIQDSDQILEGSVWRVQVPPTDNILVRDLITKIERITAKKISCTFDESRDRQREIYSPIIGLKQLPGYLPKIDLASGIKSMLDNS